MDWLSSIRTWLSDNEATISAIAAMIVIAGVVFAGFRWLVSRRSQPTTEPASEEDPLLALPTGPVVAVLPFENLSRDPDQEYFSDGLTDDIITALSRFKDLFVIARNSTFRYKGQAVDVRQLNKELGARYVLEGSVRRAEARLRVTAQLLDAKDGTHLWAETYDRDLTASDIFELQDEITEQVVGTIASSFGVISRARFAEIKEKPAGSLDAYECGLRAAAYFADTQMASEHARLRDDLERSVKSNPGDANLWAYLSSAYMQEYIDNLNPLADSRDRALEAAQRAVALDATNQRAHHALAVAHFFRNELDAFFAEAQRSIALNPNNARVLGGLGTFLHWAGDERGIAFTRKAMKLDPSHPKWLHSVIAFDYIERGEYEEALAALRMVTHPRPFWAQINLVVIYAALERKQEGKSALEELMKIYPGFNTEKLIAEWRKYHLPDDRIGPWLDGLRKAGLPE